MSLATNFTLFIASIAANLPFINGRLFALFPLPHGLAQQGGKPHYLRVLEWLLAYFLVGSIARALEANAGQVVSQNGEFYVVTACIFGVLAFPGFIFCYLLKRSKKRHFTHASKNSPKAPENGVL